MSASNHVFKKLNAQAETIRRKDERIRELKRALKASERLVATLTSNNETDEEYYGHYSSEENSAMDNEEHIQLSPRSEDGSCQEDVDDDEEDSDTESDYLPEPIFDESDGAGTYYCKECAYEVVGGLCQAADCGQKHKWNLDDIWLDSTRTSNQAIHPDRSLVPRGTTPLLSFKERLEHSSAYSELRRRGATRLMCETFHLEFTYEKGIFAWADPQLYEEFSGQAMQRGDFWKIHLGRRVQLDEDDEDGAAFIEGLLEDALLFPIRTRSINREFEKWETVEESPGIWVTRMKAHKQPKSDNPSGDADGLSSDCEDRECADAVPQAEDNNLENPPAVAGLTVSNNYATLSDEVNFSDESEYDEPDKHEDQEDLQDDPGYSIQANIPDGVWSQESGEIDELDEQEGDNSTLDDQAMDVESSDSFDSDFDDDEVMSGDERILANGARWLAQSASGKL